MRNIVIITGGFSLPNTNASAIRAIALARTLKIVGYEPIIAGFVKDEQYKECNWCEFDGVLCYNRHNSVKIATDISFIDGIENKYHYSEIYAIIAYNYPGIALNKLRRWANHRQIKMAVDITEWYGWELDERQLKDAIVRKFYTEYRMRILNRKIGNIICTTNYLADYYNKYHTLVLPAIDDNSFDEKINSSDRFMVNHPRKFFYAGSPGYKFRKDKINLVVQMFERLSNEGFSFQFDIYGVTQDEYEKFFPSPNTKSGEIVFHGRVSRQMILEQLNKSDFSVLLRPNDRVCKAGFSSKSMESISSGVPLIANDVNGDFVRYFDNGQALLCAPVDLDAFYNLLKKASTMPDEDLRQMKKSCINNNPFHYKNYLKSLSTFMNELR